MAATASSGSPAPAAAPTAAVTQTDAAVVRPCTESRRTKISPAPRNPMPVTIWAATRDGSTTTWPVRSTSLNPYLLTSMNRAPHPDQGVRAQPGALLPDLPLQPDDRGQQQAQAKLADLHRALGVGGRRGRELMTQQRVSYPITITASMSCDADSD